MSTYFFAPRALLATAVISVGLPLSAHAAQPPAPSAPATGEAAGRVNSPEEDDFRQTPYTRFGDFNSEEEEEEDTKFLQYGRFFGVSIGAGYQGATGNRGLLYSGGFPALEVKFHYWFDFNFAFTAGISNAKHSFSGKPDGAATTAKYDVNIFKMGADFRYYFDTRDLSAPVTFSGPYLTAGVGSYVKTQTELGTAGEATKDNALGFNAGAGLEFVMKPKKVYLNLEGKVHAVNFQDTPTSVALEGGTAVDNTEGLFFTTILSLLFTW